MVRVRTALLILLAGVPLFAACSAKKEVGGPGTPGYEEPEEFDDSAGGDATGVGERAIGIPAIYFDYDSSSIRRDQRSIVEANASELKTSGTQRVVLAGHCDERGSDEYNLALGERRANAVRKHLIDLGIEGSRLDTVSYGEDQPAVAGSSESAWRMNRRVEFLATN
jgi:peptidoglycan-associated lipoprotein